MLVLKALDYRTASMVTVLIDPNKPALITAYDSLDQDMGEVTEFNFNSDSGHTRFEFLAAGRKVEAVVVEVIDGKTE